MANDISTNIKTETEEVNGDVTAKNEVILIEGKESITKNTLNPARIKTQRIKTENVKTEDGIKQEKRSIKQEVKKEDVKNRSEYFPPMLKEEEEEIEKMLKDVSQETINQEVFSEYRCEQIPSQYKCVKHPGNIVEAGSLAAQSLPQASYNLLDSLAEDMLTQGKLSDLQIEGILYACQRHQLVLPDGKRAGFFLGDGTGVGKGRQIAGIIYDNLCRGRKKHIWFSISADLRHDAERDLRDVGCFTKVIDGCQELDRNTKAFGLCSDYKEGVLFSTYSTLVSSSIKGSTKSTRLDQLLAWCGRENFQGCLVFDESHKAKHFVPGKEERSTKVALAVTMIQRMLPKARVVYCSATGVTDVKNMGFMERLGLWGDGTTFSNFESFLYSLTSRGLGALEMLSMEMKAAGMYLSRGLSYEETEFVTVEATLTGEQVEVFNTAVETWMELKRCLEIAYNRVGMSNGRAWTHFWGCHQRFFKQLCSSMKVPEIVRQAKQALEEGCSVVIGLQTTGEASLASELDQNDGEINGFVSLTREILKRFIFQNFPTQVANAPEAIGKIDDWCVCAKGILLEQTEKLQLPNSPLDEMIDELGGPGCVAEMTGRNGFIGRYNHNEKPRYFTRGSAQKGVETASVQERNAFMSGEKLVAIISDAASTGISLHADHRVDNQRRRVHITAELPWSADKAVQQLGRSHRSNQSSGPIYKLLTSNLGGERRFAAAVAKRLQSLGAITKGDRRAATNADLSQFNFDTPYGRQALRIMYTSILRNELCAGVVFSDVLKNADQNCSYEVFNETLKKCLADMDILHAGIISDGDSTKITKFLNRILGLEVQKQNLIFSYFCQCLDATTAAAKREGRYNDGVTDIRGNSIKKTGEDIIVFKESQIGASVTRHASVLVDRGVSFTQAKQKLQQRIRDEEGSQSGFYRSKRDQYGKKLYLLALQKQLSPHLFMVTRPNTGTSQFEEDKNDLLHKYDKIKPEEAELGWNQQFEQTKDGCIHGNKCRHKDTCEIGTRMTEVHLLTGRILSILPALENVVHKFAIPMNLPRELRVLRVVRMELDTGERMVGLRYPSSLITEAESHLSEQRLLQQAKTGRVGQFLIEEESPVNEKSKTKALTKPPTITKYFKAKQTNEQSIESKETNDKRKPSIKKSSNDSTEKSKDANDKIKSAIGSSTSRLSTTPSVKRKQGNIFSMITTKKSKRDKKCPVCQLNLNDFTNEDVNKHIDNCVIE